MKNKIIQGDCIEEMKLLPENSVDAIVTDPPYALGFMGKAWDKFPSDIGPKKPFANQSKENKMGGYPFQNWMKDFGIEALRVLKPGGFLLSFGGTRTYHRLVCGIEDAGFEIRDTIMWLYGSGFPKSLNIGKQIDKIQGNERNVIGTKNHAKKDFKDNLYAQDPANRNNEKVFGYGEETLTKGNSEWEGWGTSIKPSNEPIVVAQKPLNTLNHIDILCRLIGYVKDVERSLKLKVVGLKEGKEIIVQENVPIQQEEKKENLMEIGKVENLKDVMDTLQFSQKEKDTNLNTILLWKNILEEIYKELNKSTISMESEMTTELKILNSLLYQNIQNFIILEKSQANGNQSNVQLVENLLKSMLLKLRSINTIFVQENVIKKELNISPNCNPIVVARKPLSEKNVALNVLKWGTGGINIDDCRIGFEDTKDPATNPLYRHQNDYRKPSDCGQRTGEVIKFTNSLNPPNPQGRFPANIILNEEAGKMLDEQSGESISKQRTKPSDTISKPTIDFGGGFKSSDNEYSDKGGASRFFQNINKGCFLCCNTITKDNKEEWKNTNANNVEKNLKTIQAIKESSVQKNAMEILKEKLAQNVKGVGNLCDLCVTNIAHILVEIKNSDSKKEELIAGVDYITEFKRNILIQNLVRFVGLWENTDTIPTTENLMLLFGSVQNAIKDYTPKENNEILRFKYTPKASKSERNFGCEELTPKQIDIQQPHNSKDLEERYTMTSKNNHPTVKPIKLMEYLVKLVSKEGSLVLDPFLGSGTTGIACAKLSRNFIGIEKEEEYIKIANARIKPFLEQEKL